MGASKTRRDATTATSPSAHHRRSSMPLYRGAACVLLAIATAITGLAKADPYTDARTGYDSITAAHLRAHLQLLASETMQGRETATPQLQIAGDYLASVFALAGV